MSKVVYVIKGNNDNLYCQFNSFSDLEEMCISYGIQFLGKKGSKEIWSNLHTGKTYDVEAIGA